MKLIKITEEHYIVVDETIDINENNYTFKGKYNGHIITHSTIPKGMVLMEGLKRLSIQEVKELLGYVDVEKKAQNIHYECQNQGLNADGCFNQYQGYIKGYKQALEDNKDKKYTEEDLRTALWELGDVLFNNNQNGIKEGEPQMYINYIIQSFQPKTEWEVEITDGKLKLK